MKQFLKATLITSLLVATLPISTSSAQDSSMCASFGEIIPNQNPSFQHINCLLTEAALKAEIPPEVVKAVAWAESDWMQFKNGQPNTNSNGDGGIGIMQLTNKPSLNQEKLRDDIMYNIEQGVKVLAENYNNRNLPKIKDSSRQTIENWYFPVMAYNGIKPVNSPLFQNSGLPNTEAYQEKVFNNIENQSFQNNIKLAGYPFQVSDFNYDRDSNQNIEFLKKEYVLTESTHKSIYYLQKGDTVKVNTISVKFREKPNTSSNSINLTNNTLLTITDRFTFDDSTAKNHFVWFPVQTKAGKKGYISSAYIEEYDGPIIQEPIELPIDNQRPVISGADDINIKVGSPFDRFEGVTAKDETDGDITAKVEVEGQVDSKIPGSYTLTYKVTDAAGNSEVKKRIISVIDDIKPTLSGLTDKKINLNSTFDPRAGVKAKDNVDGDITKEIIVSKLPETKKPGKYPVTYSVTDSSGNQETKTRIITVVDHIKPTISGVKNVTIKLNSKFDVRKGITAKDNIDGNLTNKINITGASTFTTKKKGTYILKYNVTDKAGNKAVEVTRKITVK